MIISEL